MSKVICDVCGTAFAETAEQCPICGCAKAPAAQAVTGENENMSGENSTAYGYVKGGRFSKGNVKRAGRSNPPVRRQPEKRRDQEESQESNKGLILVVVVLLLAIVMVVVYIGVKVFLSDLSPDTGNDNPSQSTGEFQDTNPSDVISGIPCTELTLNSALVELNSAGQYLLEARPTPENTTDKVVFTSDNPQIADVDANGLITPIGYGQTIIRVTCGNVTAECIVISTVGESVPDTQPTEPSNPTTSVPDGFVLKLNTYKDSGEITISSYGASHKLYTEVNDVKASDITWTVEDPAVATVENGVVVGVGKGTTKVIASIGGQTATCLVRCSFETPAETEPAPYRISHSDVTIGQGETFTLSLKDSEGANVQGVEWTASVEGAVEINGNKITGGTVESLTKVTVSTEYEGVTYQCIVYVKAPAAE